MADFLGTLGGAGMLAVIGLLVLRFLRETGKLTGKTARLILRAALHTAVVGCAYLLLCVLLRQALLGDAVGNDFFLLFGGDYVHTALNALDGAPTGPPLTWLFTRCVSALGALLFRQYRAVGFALAFGMTAAAEALIAARLSAVLDEKRAEDAAFLLLCLPGGVLVWMPCGAPLGLLLAAVCFYFFGKKLPTYAEKRHSALYGWALAVCGCLSGAAAYGFALGQWG